MRICMTKRASTTRDTKIPFCEEKERLAQDFLGAVREFMEWQTQQTDAVIAGDFEFARFDDLIHMAREKKDNAKYALISHIETHRC